MKKRPNGSIPQHSVLGNPADAAIRKYFAPTRGIIEVVNYRDQSDRQQTTAQVYLLYHQARIYDVPFLTSRMSKTASGQWHGEEFTPEAGNMVLVTFVDGNRKDPVITDCFNAPNNPIQATSQEAPHFRRLQNGTEETIAKDGSRAVTVAANETLNVTGSGTIVIGEGLTITCQGNINIVTNGGMVTVQTPGGTPNGIVTGDCLCAFTNQPHAMVSATVKASK